MVSGSMEARVWKGDLNKQTVPSSTVRGVLEGTTRVSVFLG